MTLEDGIILMDKLKTVGNAPGYREVSIEVEVDRGGSTETLELNFSKDDAYTLMSSILDAQILAWKNSEGPIDIEAGETKPNLLIPNK